MNKNRLNQVILIYAVWFSSYCGWRFTEGGNFIWSANGKRAKEYMEKGQLVPKEIVFMMVKERLLQSDSQENGWLLDGFPRRLSQATALKEIGFQPDIFILLEDPPILCPDLVVAEDNLVERVVGRRLDPVTGRIYHLKYSPPETEEIAARLTQRFDDTEEMVKLRLRTHHQNVESVLSMYEDITIKINGNASKEDVFSQIDKALTTLIQQKNATLGSMHGSLKISANKRDRIPFIHLTLALIPIVVVQYSLYPLALFHCDGTLIRRPRLSRRPPEFLVVSSGSKPEPLKVMISGAPASVKGHMSAITQKYGLVHIAAGDLLRAEISSGSANGKRAKEYMEKGQLVPNEIVVMVDGEGAPFASDSQEMVGFWMDTQELISSNCLKELDSARHIYPSRSEVAEDNLVERVVGRRLDPVTGRIYHLKYSPPENEEIAARLTQRFDDTEEKVNGNDSKEDVFSQIDNALTNLIGQKNSTLVVARLVSQAFSVADGAARFIRRGVSV
ncbi:hypothetical protein C3L33_21733, partial [Rhododendron williamsianum]